MMKKKVMILGASILQLPAILKAKDMGLEVIAVDADVNAIGFKEADVCLLISTLDIPGVLNAARTYNIDGIMTLASDMPMRTIAKIAEECELPGISVDTAYKATNKVEMRQCLKMNGIPEPKFSKINTFEDLLLAIPSFSTPLILKPADNSGSRGVMKLEKAMDHVALQEAFNYCKGYSRNGDLLVEEYMVGEEVSVETISMNGRCHVIQITDKLTTGAPHFVEMGHSQPSHHPKNIVENIKKVTSAAVHAIGIENGPSHTEIIVTKDGPKIVELGARLGGDCIASHLVPLSTGVDMVRCTIEIALGINPDISIRFSKGSAIRYLPSSNGVLQSVTGLDDAQRIHGIKNVVLQKAIGVKLSGIENSNDRIGFIISQADDAQEAVKRCEIAMNTIKVEIL